MQTEFGKTKSGFLFKFEPDLRNLPFKVLKNALRGSYFCYKAQNPVLNLLFSWFWMIFDLMAAFGRVETYFFEIFSQF